MKRFLTTTALVLAMTGSANAQTQAVAFDEVQMQPSDFYASDLIGMRIYNSETPVAADTQIADGGEAEWDDIGEINDIIVTADGNISAVILGIGGFLGAGERDIAVPMSAIKIVQEEGDSDDRFLVVSSSKEALEAIAPYERADAESDMTDMPAASSTMADPAADPAMTSEATADRTPLMRPNVSREGYSETEVSALTEMTAEKLEGATVYGANDEEVGEIDALIVGDDGAINEVVVNVGGFLGMGEKSVGVTFDELQILSADDGDEYRVYIDSTKENLENQPEYEVK
jgi:ribosomal 30S subunit maturation factor RimM